MLTAVICLLSVRIWKEVKRSFPIVCAKYLDTITANSVPQPWNHFILITITSDLNGWDTTRSHFEKYTFWTDHNFYHQNAVENSAVNILSISCLDGKLMHNGISVFLCNTSIFFILALMFKQHHNHYWLRKCSSTNNPVSTIFIHLPDWRSLSLNYRMSCRRNLIILKICNLFAYHKMLISFYLMKSNLTDTIFLKLLLTPLDRIELFFIIS